MLADSPLVPVSVDEDDEDDEDDENDEVDEDDADEVLASEVPAVVPSLA